MNIGIVIHSIGNVDFDVYKNHLSVIASLPNEHNYSFYTTRDVKVAEARNCLVDMAIDKHVDKILFLDTDHILPLDILNLLLQSDADIVSGLICKRSGNYEQVGFVKKDDLFYNVNIVENTGIYDVDICAFGCTLVNLSIFKKLDKPYFEDINSIRSDVNFCNNVKKAGGKIQIHSHAECGHLISEPLVVYPHNVKYIKNAYKQRS